MRSGVPIRLTELEAGLLNHLCLNVGHVVTSQHLLSEVWGYASTVRSRAVDNTVSRLRKKLGNDATRLQTVYGQGYCLLQTTEQPLLGREHDLERLAKLVANNRIATVVGLGGVGKSHLVRALTEQWPTHLWLELHDPENSDAFRSRLAGELDLGSTAAEQIPLRLASLPRTLVVIDGAEHLGAWVIDLLTTWSGKAPRINWVMTSRRRFDDEPCLELGPLAPSASVELLSRLVDGSNEGDARWYPRLVERVDHLPLGIELVAARLRVVSGEELSSWLDSHGITVIDGPRHRLSSMFDGCWALLDDDQRRCLSIGAWLGHAFRALHLCEVAELSPTETLDALDQLQRAGMVSRRGHAFTMLDLVRDFALQKIDPPLRQVLLGWTTDRARWLYDANDSDLPTREELSEMVAILLRAIEWASTEDVRAQILLGIRVHDRRHGPLLRTLDDFDALSVERLPPELAARVWIERGRLHTEADHRERALQCHEEGVRIASELSDPILATRAEIELTNIVRMLRGPAFALPSARRVVAAVEEAELPSGLRLAALSSLEGCLTSLGHFEEAYRSVLRALALAAGRLDAQPQLRTRLGYILRMMGEPHRARRELERAFELAKTLGLERRAILAGRQLANLLSNDGELERALAVAEEAGTLAERIGDTSGLLAMRMARASMAMHDNPDLGFQLYEEVREQALLFGRAREAAVACMNLGLAHHQSRRLEKAAAAYQECLEIIEPVGWRYVIAMTQCFSALLLAAQGRDTDARRQLDEARPGSAMGRRVQESVIAFLDEERNRAEALLDELPHEIGAALRSMMALADEQR